MATNRAAYLSSPGTLSILDAPLPTAGPNEIVIHNAAIAMNPLDNHMFASGIFVQTWPAILGCDVAGVVHEIGSGVTRFKKGDRVIGHCINLTTGRPEDGSFQLFTAVREDKAAVLPDGIPFTEGVVVPFALEAALCALCVKEPGPAMPGVLTPALGLPYPSLKPSPTGKILIVYGASSSVGSMTLQLATLSGVSVIAICGASNISTVQSLGAVSAFNHKDESLVQKVIEATKSIGEFIGIFDAISTPETYAHDLQILEAMGGGHLACVHPPPEVPANVKTGMIFAVNDVAAPVFRDFVTEALEKGVLKCFPPPMVVGKRLEKVEGALKVLERGVSARKVVVEL